jgi:ElaB/YqjD/DUF883 family membrane-anchored ribosome-binding protein
LTEIAAEPVRSRRERAMARVTEAVDSARVGIDRVADLANRSRGDAEEFAKDNPLLVLGVAFLVGIGIGAIATAAISGRKSRD